MRFSKVKKIFVLLGAVTLVSFSSFSPLKAQSSADMSSVVAVLNQILDRVNTLPAALVSLSAYISAWMNPDTTQYNAQTPTPTMVGSFTQLGNLFTADMNTQSSLQPSLNASLLNNDGSDVYFFNNGTSANSQSPATSSTLPYANDLIYSTLLGMPFFAKDPRASGGSSNKIDSSMNYIMNASGLNIYHIRPGNNWQGSQTSQTRYQTFYNTVMAATSFNSYLLSNVYADKNQYTTLQQTLIQQATDPQNWFAQVSSEPIGTVLRQLLLYQSQIFVLLTQLIQLQKQMVAAEAMNTAVLIATNQMNENTMAAGAQGKNPSI